MKFKFWSVYFINKEGHREGKETIAAQTREEAIVLYKRFFNVNDPIIAVPCWSKS